jgi:hypothetical protein
VTDTPKRLPDGYGDRFKTHLAKAWFHIHCVMDIVEEFGGDGFDSESDRGYYMQVFNELPDEPDKDTTTLFNEGGDL